MCKLYLLMEPFLWGILWDENLTEHTGNGWFNIFFFFKSYTYGYFVCVPCVWVAFQKRVSTFPKLELQMVVSHPSRVPGI